MHDLSNKCYSPEYSIPGKCSAQYGDTSLITCPISAKELESCFTALGLNPHIDNMHYAIHNASLNNAIIMEFYDLTQVEIEILPINIEYFNKLRQEFLN